MTPDLFRLPRMPTITPFCQRGVRGCVVYYGVGWPLLNGARHCARAEEAAAFEKYEAEEDILLSIQPS